MSLHEKRELGIVREKKQLLRWAVSKIYGVGGGKGGITISQTLFLFPLYRNWKEKIRETKEAKRTGV